MHEVVIYVMTCSVLIPGSVEECGTLCCLFCLCRCTLLSCSVMRSQWQQLSRRTPLHPHETTPHLTLKL